MNNIDLNELEPHEILELAYALIEDGDGMEKEASGMPDLNDLSVDEFLDFAEGLEEALVESGEIEKVAGIKDWAKKGWEGAKSAGKRYGDLVTAKSARADVGALAGRTGKGKASTAMDILRGKWGSGAASASGKGSRRAELMKALGAQAGTAAGAGAAGAGGIAAYRHHKKK